MYPLLAKHTEVLFPSTPKLLFSAGLLSLLLSGCGGGDSADADRPAPDRPIAYVERTLSTSDDPNDPMPVEADITEPTTHNAGARLIIRQRASINASETVIEATDFPSPPYDPNYTYDIKDLSASPDGTKLAFARRAFDPNLDDDDPSQFTWNIWEYDVTTSQLRRVIASGIEAELGHDIAPAYLADGRIVFSSTRQKTSRNILQNESTFYNKSVFSHLTDSRNEDNGPAYNLHVMQADPNIISAIGQGIEQITFNQSHDLQPVLLHNGKIAFLRWDRFNGRDQLSLFTLYPDGTNLSFLYGFHDQNEVTNSNNSQEEATFFDLSQMPDGRLLAVLKQRDNTDTGLNDGPILGGDLVAINTAQYTEPNEPIGGGSGSNGQQPISQVTVLINDDISEGGYFNSASPYNDGSNRLLVSWTPCRLNNPDNTAIITCTSNNLNTPGVTEAEPFYGLWSYNPSGVLDRIASPSPGSAITDVAVLAPRSTQPAFISNSIDDLYPDTPYRQWLKDVSENLDSGYGGLFIDSIYDFDGVTDQTPGDVSIADVANPAQPAYNARTARFLRVIKAVSFPYDPENEILPDFNANAAFGVASRAQGMREILGYAPIEPDGSVAVSIPANVPFHIEIVDASGQRLPGFDRHRNWLQVASGEVKVCTGCHTDDSTFPHGRREAEAASLNLGAPTPGAPFPNTSSMFIADVEPSKNPQTMAEVYLDAQAQTMRKLEPNIIYSDVWTDDTIPGLSKEADVTLRYTEPEVNPSTALVNIVPAPPSNDGCLRDWTSVCRIIINYETHIQPIWEATRTGENDYQCVSCHTSNGNLQQPAGNLELTTQEDANSIMLSYRELLINDTVALANRLRFVRDVNNNQVFLMDDNGTPADPNDDTFVLDGDGNQIPLVEPAPVDQIADLRVQRIGLNGNPIVVTDGANGAGNPILDGNGNEIPVTDAFNETLNANITRRMISGNAVGSRFFDIMTNPANASNATFNHTRLNQVDNVADTTDDGPLIKPEELRLISEWLDIGAQYYNNPFDAPTN